MSDVLLQWAIQPKWVIDDKILEKWLQTLQGYYEMSDVFGPLLWDEIDFRVISYTKEKSQGIKWYIESLKQTIPCSECAKHLSDYVRLNPVNTSSQIAFAKWVLWLHNTVNKRNGKKERTIDKYIKKIYKQYLDFAESALSEIDKWSPEQQNDTTTTS